MNRRTFLQITAGALFPLLSCGRFRRKQPNIIFIMADDLGYADLGCYGQEKIRTPHLDRMAAEGIRLTDHYAGSTVCAPARCTLMTGLHTGHAVVRGNYEVQPEGQYPLPPESLTVGEVLQAAGYATGVIGKWGLGGPGSSGEPNRQGFDYWYGHLCQREAHFYYDDHLWRNGKKVVLEGNDPQRQTGQYVHDLFTREALQFIERNQQGPFFLYLPYTIPHAELAVPEDSLAAYRGQFPETPFPGGHYGAQPAPHAAYGAMITRMDRDIGRVFRLLQDLEIDENTLVIFTSDNGPSTAGGIDPVFFDSNGPLRGGKRDLYEGGIRVPLIARWPGRIKPGTVSNHPSAFWDFLPTAAEIAGIKPPDGIDGISYLPALMGEPQPVHEYFYWEFPAQGGKQAVRMGRWKGVRLNTRTDPNGAIELYDLANDVGEARNVASEHPDVVRQITDIMQQAHTDSGAFPLFGQT